MRNFSYILSIFIFLSVQSAEAVRVTKRNPSVKCMPLLQSLDEYRSSDDKDSISEKIRLVSESNGTIKSQLHEFIRSKIIEIQNDPEILGKDIAPGRYRVLVKLLAQISQLLAQNNGKILNKSDTWLKAFANRKTFDSWLEKDLGLSNDLYSKKLSWLINLYMKRSVESNETSLKTFVSREDQKLYLAEHSDWIPLNPIKSHLEMPSAVPATLIREILRVLKRGYLSQLLVHSTMSSALSGIAKAKAILSGKEVTRRRLNIESGEFHSLANGIILNNIYGLRTNDPTSLLMTYYNWFDDFPVTFSIDSDSSWRLIVPKETDFEDHGVKLGSNVPISAINYVFAPANKLPELREWIEKDLKRRTMVISYEAARIIAAYNLDGTFEPEDLKTDGYEEILEVIGDTSR